MKYKHKARCLVCDHSGMVFINSKEDYREVRVCPECKGAYVDIWKLHEYQNNENNQIEIIMTNPNKPPMIKINGQGMSGIKEVQYNYTTRDNKSHGQHNFAVKYHDKETNVIRTVAVNKLWEG